MRITDLSEEQAEEIEARLSAFDENHITYKMEGRIQIGMEEDGKLIAGLDACMTAFRILYVSTVFVDEAYRRKGVGTRLIREMERRAAAMGANTIRLDTFDWQGKEFYEALGYEAAGHYDNDADGYSEYFFLKRLDCRHASDQGDPCAAPENAGGKVREESGDLAERIARVTEMEARLNRIRAWLEAPAAPGRDPAEDALRLEEYLESAWWRADFETEEAGGFPADLPRGVLSEDGIYNALEAYRERMNELGGREKR